MVSVFRVADSWQQVKSSTLPAGAIGQDVLLKLKIDELQRHTPEQIQARFSVLRKVKNDCAGLEGNTFRLSWRNKADGLVTGDIVVAKVCLKPPWASLNPGGFDYPERLLGAVQPQITYLLSVTVGWMRRGNPCGVCLTN